MVGIFSHRVAGVAAVILLALVTAGLITYPASPPTDTENTEKSGPRPTTLVNRAGKGDRLPSIRPTLVPHESEAPLAPVRTMPQREVPAGCDQAFSPISAPALAHVFRRCLT
jgi:hypothetical protein